MPTPLIRDASPPLVWDALQDQTVRVPLTPRDTLTLADYGTFTLTIRQDPEWPRKGSAQADLATADPIADGWEVAATGTATAAAEDEEVELAVTVPADPGERRYALDVVASGGTAGRVQVVRSTWLTVVSTLKSSG